MRLLKEGAALHTLKGRGYPITLSKEGAIRDASKRRSSSPSSRRKEQPLVFQTEGPVSYVAEGRSHGQK